MQQKKNFGFLHYGISVTVLLSAVLGFNLFQGDMTLFKPGATSDGHHQIKMQCTVCHLESFQAGEQMQKACMNCHEEPLIKVRDTHPKKKFTDPRNAELLTTIDPTRCVTCHVEHSPEITDQFGVTLPTDFCFYCHEDIGEEKKNHQDYAFEDCSNSGCHNYHDNRALYEQFLVKHIDEPALRDDPDLKVPNALEQWLNKNKDKQPLKISDSDGSSIDGNSPAVVSSWAESAHAQVQVNCMGCHDNANWMLTDRLLTDSLGYAPADLAIDSCAACHDRQHQSFKQGLHGMKLSIGAAPMQVEDARLPMKKEPQHDSLTCSSCHDPHKPDLQFAATEACLQCHDDEHSLNYQSSPHASLGGNELDAVQARQAKPDASVSCATCHMPRIKKGKKVFVEHNQSMTLAPNSKMLRPVCLNCHGLEFSTAALADRSLIKRNFSGSFDQQHPSFELVKQRLADKKAKKNKKAKDRKD
ncbi:MAG: formate-dependent nitrite reductase cytochrome c552 subunit [Arenicella sp.]|jgi:formate-dependent nitrite reductase cytochrome c552 subunit